MRLFYFGLSLNGMTDENWMWKEETLDVVACCYLDDGPRQARGIKTLSESY